MGPHRSRKPRPPLDRAGLEELALTYVGRFATTRAKLSRYLRRKLNERGWGGEGEPPVEDLVARLAQRGYVDDAAYALSKSRSLGARGYGAGRLRQALRADGVRQEDAAAAEELASEEKVEAALRYARRRKLGPFADSEPDRRGREKALAAMIRAGHALELARAIVDLQPGTEVDPVGLAIGS